MSARTLEVLVPGDLAATSGGYGYDRRIIDGLRALGWRVGVRLLDASFPEPKAAALAHAHDTLARLPDQALVLLDGLAGGAMPRVLRAHAARLRLVALVHHPLAAESGLTPAQAQGLQRSEQQTLQLMRHVIVTSRATALALHSYGIAPERVSVVEPGTDPAPLVRPARGALLRLLCVATLIPRKGHDLLIEALARVPARWRLHCIGSLERSPATVERLRAQLDRLQLQDKVSLVGEVDAATLEDHYRQADLFVLATRLEGYGMAVAEALAHGLPVLATATGAIEQLVGPDAGVVVAPDDAVALSAALTELLTDPAMLPRLAAGAARVREELPRWPQACARMSEALALQHAPD